MLLQNHLEIQFLLIDAHLKTLAISQDVPNVSGVSFAFKVDFVLYFVPVAPSQTQLR